MGLGRRPEHANASMLPTTSSPDAAGFRGIVRNISWLTGASLIVKPAWLVFMVAACPRILGVEGYGVFAAALALAAIATSFSDLGASHLTVREVAQRRDRAGRYFSNILAYRGVLLALTWVGAVLAALVLGYEGAALTAVVVAGFYWVAQHVVFYERTFFRAFEDLRYDAVSNVVEKSLVIGLGVALLVATGTATGTLAGMAAGMVLVALGQGAWLSRRLAPLSSRLLSRDFIRGTAIRALPLGMADLLTVLYLRVDQLMIEAFMGPAAVGPYGQAYRILEALSIIPVIVAQSTLFPRLSVLTHAGQEALFRRITAVGSLALLATGLVIAGALFVIGPAMMRAFAPDPAFAPAGDVIRVLCWTFPFTVVKDMLFVAFLAKGRIRFPVVVYAIVTALNIALNALLIPIHGILGAAWTTVACESLVVMLYVAYLIVLVRRPARAGASL